MLFLPEIERQFLAMAQIKSITRTTGLILKNQLKATQIELTKLKEGGKFSDSFNL